MRMFGTVRARARHDFINQSSRDLLVQVPNVNTLSVMLGMDSFASGAKPGVMLGVTRGFLNVITGQIFGTGWIDWSASKAGA